MNTELEVMQKAYRSDHNIRHSLTTELEEGINYNVLAGQTIGTWKRVTQAYCKDIAASIEKRNQWGSQRLYWSYEKNRKICSIKTANGNSSEDSNFVSGYMECGTRIPGRILNI